MLNQGKRQACRAALPNLFPRSPSLLVPFLLIAALAFAHKEESALGPFMVELPAPVNDVVEVVKAVCNDNVIHGTYVYEKDRTLRGAKPAEQSAAFHPWAEGGQVFFKVAENVLAPTHFVNSNGMGTITVRYIVQTTGPTTTSLRIEAVFLEDEHRRTDRSLGAVESAEYQEIKQRLDAMQAKRQHDADEVARLKQEDTDRRAVVEKRKQQAKKDAEEQSSLEELQQKLNELRHEVEVRPKSDGVPLKAAPYRNSATLASLPSKSEMVVLVVTPYWYGVQTQDGHNGWVRTSELEPIP